MDVSPFHQFEHGSGTHVWNWTVCVVHVDRNAVAAVIDESEGVGCQDEGSLCRDRHKEKSEHIARCGIGMANWWGMKVSFRCIYGRASCGCRIAFPRLLLGYSIALQRRIFLMNALIPRPVMISASSTGVFASAGHY